MRVLVACEFSGRVTDAFRARGHEAWSCDLLPTMSKKPFHFQTDLRNVTAADWDMVIAFPPCTYLTQANQLNPALMRTESWQAARKKAADFFMMIAYLPVDRLAIENPKGWMSSQWRKPDQTIQPWQFGHPFTKLTCLWLRGLPQLRPTRIVQPKVSWTQHATRSKLQRSLTFPGVALAMAEQWG